MIKSKQSLQTYIILLNWNNYQDTLECLESLFKQDYKEFKIILCDNDSTDGSVEHFINWAEGKELSITPKNLFLQSLVKPAIKKPISYCVFNREQAETKTTDIETGANLIIIKTGGNLGFAGGNNVGLRYALKRNDFDYVWLLNNDTVVKKDCLSKMVKYSQSKSLDNLCGSLLVFYDNPESIQAPGGYQYNKWTGRASPILKRGTSIHEKINHPQLEKKLSYICAASWLLPKQFLLDIGLMTEDYFLYGEEIDWCLRNSGKYKLCYCPDAIVYHKEGATIGSENLDRESSLFSDFYQFRNKFLITRRFYPEKILIVYITVFLQMINRLRKGQWKKAKLICQILLGKKTF